MNDSNARPQTVEPPPYLPSFSHSDSCDRYYADDADTTIACTCGAGKAQAWLDRLVAEREAIIAEIRAAVPLALPSNYDDLPRCVRGLAMQRDNQHELKDHLAEVARKLTEERARIAESLLAHCDAAERNGFSEVPVSSIRAAVVAPTDSRFANQPPDIGHQFTFTVEMRGEGCNWSSTLVPVTVRAYNLRDAIRQAEAIPFAQWFPDEDETEQHQAPTEPGRCRHDKVGGCGLDGINEPVSA